mmetsp:Transcript_58519/g.124149  ORF Transcript_58519/g.124149 Transcript_58519/m.124149 type:complete len:115 (+) Transcript_58519:2-346(+)
MEAGSAGGEEPDDEDTDPPSRGRARELLGRKAGGVDPLGVLSVFRGQERLGEVGGESACCVIGFRGGMQKSFEFGRRGRCFVDERPPYHRSISLKLTPAYHRLEKYSFIRKFSL